MTAIEADIELSDTTAPAHISLRAQGGSPLGDLSSGNHLRERTLVKTRVRREVAVFFRV